MSSNILAKEYKDNMRSNLQKKLELKNTMQIPAVTKVVVSTCVGTINDRTQALESAQKEIALITGQHPILTKAKKSISNFKLRAGMEIGVKVTLRRNNMYDFLMKLIKVTIPTIRDFRGLSPKSFDKQGNYTLGINDHTIFPEIELDKIYRNLGLEVVICTSAKNSDEAKTLLEELGIPFRKNNKIN